MESVNWAPVLLIVGVITLLLWLDARRGNRKRLPRSVREKVWIRDQKRCHYCKRLLRNLGDVEIDHRTPRSRGGSDHESNLRTSCHSCNHTKGARTPEQAMMREYGSYGRSNVAPFAIAGVVAVYLAATGGDYVGLLSSILGLTLDILRTVVGLLGDVIRAVT